MYLTPFANKMFHLIDLCLLCVKNRAMADSLMAEYPVLTPFQLSQADLYKNSCNIIL